MGQTMSKYLYVTFSDRKVYRIPAEVIALSRADYYVQHDLDTEHITPRQVQHAMKEEYEYALEDNSILFDWAQNNIDWEDVQEDAEFVNQHMEDVDSYHDQWPNARMIIGM